MKILVINAGSSSLKYQLLDPDTKEVLAKGLCERIGLDGHIKHTPTGKDVYDADRYMPDHEAAIKLVMEVLTHNYYGVIKDMSEIDAVGHRVVHGGEEFTHSVIIDKNVMKGIRECIPLAPLHNPANITGIEACKEVMPNTPMVAVFDTAFHQTMPPKAYIYAVPYRWYTENKVRRYGFHGTSHQYVTERAAALLGRPIEELRIASLHLGNGASTCSVKFGKSIDTSMGFTPQDGLPMGTRAGAIDAAIVDYIVDQRGNSTKRVESALNKESGVLGISGISSDFRDLEAAAAEGNERAQLAIDVFCYKVTKRIGSCCRDHRQGEPHPLPRVQGGRPSGGVALPRVRPGRPAGGSLPEKGLPDGEPPGEEGQDLGRLYPRLWRGGRGDLEDVPGQWHRPGL